jgi:thiol-disulfide isomerase/thioredoxin
MIPAMNVPVNPQLCCRLRSGACFHTTHSAMHHRVIRTACLLTLLLLGACNGSNDVDKTTGVRLYDLDGEPVRLSCAPGRMLIVNFWASWCQPCKKEIAHLLELQDEFRELGFDIVGILLDSYQREHLKAEIAELKITYPVYIGDVVTVVAKTNVPSVPATMLVDCRGEIVKKLVGYHNKEELRAAVHRMAASTAP